MKDINEDLNLTLKAIGLMKLDIPSSDTVPVKMKDLELLHNYIKKLEDEALIINNTVEILSHQLDYMNRLAKTKKVNGLETYKLIAKH